MTKRLSCARVPVVVQPRVGALRRLLLSLAGALLLGTLPCELGWAQNYRHYKKDSPPLASSKSGNFEYLGRYPDNGTPNWGDNKTATQGIAHDESNWYMSATGTGVLGKKVNDDWIIWRIPVDEPLDQDFSDSPNPNVRHVRRSDVRSLDRINATHPGDIDHFSYEGIGYLVVPMRSANGPIIAVFEASTLQYLAHTSLDSGQHSIGWCAVMPDGHLVTSNDDTELLLVYRVDWARLRTTGALTYSKLAVQTLRDSRGAPLYLRNVQGGEFTDEGGLLVMNCGVSLTAVDTDGLHVFDASTFREVARSCNPERGESGAFSYSFDNGGVPPDEPEGLTVWGLTPGRARGVRGVLHVLVYSWGALSSNKVTLMHYGRRSNR